MNFIIIYLLCFLDVTLTHYQFFLKDKKKCLFLSDEINPIPRFIMRLGKKPNPMNYLIGTFFSLTILNLIFFISKYNINFIWLCIGMYMIIINIHFHNVIVIKDNWNNKKYWSLFKKEKKYKK